MPYHLPARWLVFKLVMQAGSMSMQSGNIIREPSNP